MSNSRTRRISYKPRFTQMEAFDMLGPETRAALREGPQEWDTGSILRRRDKLVKSSRCTLEAADKLIAKEVWRWHREEVREGYPWRERKPGQRWCDVPPSPHNQADATLMTSQHNVQQRVLSSENN